MDDDIRVSAFICISKPSLTEKWEVVTKLGKHISTIEPMIFRYFWLSTLTFRHIYWTLQQSPPFVSFLRNIVALISDIFLADLHKNQQIYTKWIDTNL